MRVLILCTMMKDFGRKGFYNSQEIGLGRALNQMGHAVEIFKGILEKEQAETVELGRDFVIHYIKMPNFGAHGYFFTSLIRQKPDAIFCFSDQQIFIPHVYRYCRKNKIPFIPYVGTAHSLYENSPRARVMNFVFSRTTLPVYKCIPVLAKTPSAAKELQNLGVRKVGVALVGIDIAVLRQNFRDYDRDELRREYGCAPEDVILLNVSRLDPDKRPQASLDIFSHVRGKKKFRLLIVGAGSLKEEMLARIREEGLENEVTIMSRVPYEEMWKLYVISDYYINISVNEIFGMAIMEAVYYCTSVAARNALGPSITLKNMEGHRLCSTDQEIEEWVLSEYPPREQLQKSAGRIESDFTWRSTAEKLVRLIDKEKEIWKRN